MAFKLRSGVSGMPQAGDTIHVYSTGTTTEVSGLKTADSTAGALANPFTVPAAGESYGFEPPSSARVDVWWVEGNRYLIEDVNVRDVGYAEGTWTPTVASLTNATDCVVTLAQYARIGSLVTCMFNGSISITNATARSFFTMTLPIDRGDKLWPMAGTFFISQNASPNQPQPGSIRTATTQAGQVFVDLWPARAGAHLWWAVCSYRSAS